MEKQGDVSHSFVVNFHFLKRQTINGFNQANKSVTDFMFRYTSQTKGQLNKFPFRNKLVFSGATLLAIK